MMMQPYRRLCVKQTGIWECHILLAAQLRLVLTVPVLYAGYFQTVAYITCQETTAQGIYDQCTPVSAADAKAGDIIFFTGTYNAGRPVTHVGIYCGNGTMVHCGDPIQYTSINTSYWQSHFYGFGRLN